MGKRQTVNLVVLIIIILSFLILLVTKQPIWLLVGLIIATLVAYFRKRLYGIL